MLTDPLAIMVWIIKCLQLVIDSGMLILFMYLYYFFTKQKRNILRFESKSFTFSNWALVVWILLLVLMEWINIVIRDILSPIILVNKSDMQDVLRFIDINRYIWYQISDFMKGTTMLYLIYV